MRRTNTTPGQLTAGGSGAVHGRKAVGHERRSARHARQWRQLHARWQRRQERQPLQPFQPAAQSGGQHVCWRPQGHLQAGSAGLGWGQVQPKPKAELRPCRAGHACCPCQFARGTAQASWHASKATAAITAAVQCWCCRCCRAGGRCPGRAECEGQGRRRLRHRGDWATQQLLQQAGGKLQLRLGLRGLHGGWHGCLLLLLLGRSCRWRHGRRGKAVGCWSCPAAIWLQQAPLRPLAAILLRLQGQRPWRQLQGGLHRRRRLGGGSGGGGLLQCYQHPQQHSLLRRLTDCRLPGSRRATGRRPVSRAQLHGACC